MFSTREGISEKIFDDVGPVAAARALGNSMCGRGAGSKQDTDLCKLGGLMSKAPTKFPKFRFLSLLFPKPITSFKPFSFFLELLLKQPK